jgi:hypothetical protein
MAWTWKRIVEMGGYYVVKLGFGIVGIFVAACCAVWFYEHLDVCEVFRGTFEFIVHIPAYIMDTPLLIQMIHKWLHLVFLDYMATPMRFVWLWSKGLIIASPLSGILIIICTIVVSIAMLAIGPSAKNILSCLYPAAQVIFVCVVILAWILCLLRFLTF